MNYFAEIFNLTFRSVGLLSFIPFLLNVLLLIYAIRRLPKHPVTIVFYFFLVSLCLGQLQDTMAVFSVSAIAANFWLYFLNTGIWTNTIGLHFVLLYTRHKQIAKNIWVLTALYGISFFINAFRTTDIVRYGASMTFGELGWIEQNTLADPFFVVYTSWIFLLGLLMLGILVWSIVTNWKQTRLRNITLLIAGGMFLPLAQSLITQVLFPLFKYPELSLTSLTIFFFSLAVFIAMLRYQFLAITPSIIAPTIIATMGESLFVVNEVGEIVLVNKAACKTLQVEEKQLIGSPLRTYLPLIDELLRIAHKGTVENDIIFSNEGTTLFSSTQEHIPVSLSVAIVRDDAGKMIGLTVVCYSLRQEKKYIEELNEQTEIIKKAKGELEEKVSELERFQKLTIDRELQMVKLKGENNKLKAQIANKTN